MEKNDIEYKMFGFVKRMFAVATAFFSFNWVLFNPLKCKIFRMCCNE